MHYCYYIVIQLRYIKLYCMSFIYVQILAQLRQLLNKNMTK